MYMERRRKLDDEEKLLQRQTLYLHPERWDQLFGEAAKKAQRQPEPLTVGGRSIEEMKKEVDALDAYYENLEAKREVSGADLRYLTPDQEAWV